MRTLATAGAIVVGAVALLSGVHGQASFTVPAAENAAMASTAACASASPATSPMLPPEPPPAGASREFRTDFGKHTVPYGEILSGGPPKDGIPSIDRPSFVSVAEADT